MDAPAPRRDDLGMYDRSRTVEAARRILGQGGWCVYEACVDVPTQHWEPRILMFDLVAPAVADAVEAEIDDAPGQDGRLTGCDRRTLQPTEAMGAHLCYVADAPTPAPDVAPVPAPRERSDPLPVPELRARVSVRDAMSPVVATVRRSDTLREAARRMTARGVGAAVVVAGDAQDPCILTERDILRSNGAGERIDVELVGAHVAADAPSAEAGSPLAATARAMARDGLRHVIVRDGPDVVGILSMRDIVRCWTADDADRALLR